jgi:hypothetical protein
MLHGNALNPFEVWEYFATYPTLMLEAALREFSVEYRFHGIYYLVNQFFWVNRALFYMNTDELRCHFDPCYARFYYHVPEPQYGVRQTRLTAGFCIDRGLTPAQIPGLPE